MPGILQKDLGYPKRLLNCARLEDDAERKKLPTENAKVQRICACHKKLEICRFFAQKLGCNNSDR